MSDHVDAHYSGQDADGELARLARQLEASRREDELSRHISVEAALADLRRRGSIALTIIWLFVGVVIVLAVLYIAAAVRPALSQLTSAADKIRELVNTLVFPIVTLVLGYYFGKRAE